MRRHARAEVDEGDRSVSEQQAPHAVPARAEIAEEAAPSWAVVWLKRLAPCSPSQRARAHRASLDDHAARLPTGEIMRRRRRTRLA